MNRNIRQADIDAIPGVIPREWTLESAEDRYTLTTCGMIDIPDVSFAFLALLSDLFGTRRIDIEGE